MILFSLPLFAGNSTKQRTIIDNRILLNFTHNAYNHFIGYNHIVVSIYYCNRDEHKWETSKIIIRMS